MKPKKKRAAKSEEVERIDTPTEPSVSSEALRSVFAIFLIAIAGFLILALMGTGGAVGTSLYAGLTWLLGIGYILLPLSCFLLAAVILRSIERTFGWVQIASMLIFLLSALGLINLAFPSRGGTLGELVSHPFQAAFDTIGTIFFLLAFIIASLIIAFDVHVVQVFTMLRERIRRSQAQVLAAPMDTPITGLPMADEAPEPEEDDPSLYAPGPLPEPPRAIPLPEPKAAPAESFPVTAATWSTYLPPPLSILGKNKGKPEVGDIKANMNIIKRTLQNFGIQVEMDEASIGPTVTRYAMKPAEGVRLSKILTLQSNLELALAASPIRIEAPIPGKSLVGVEVPNISRTTLGLGPLLQEDEYANSEKPLMMALGRSITGQAHFADLAKMPHLLVAGTTGSGKSVTIHNFVVSLLFRCGPDRLRFIMVDPKRVELTAYNSIPHLLTPVITDAKKAILALKWLTKEMERRYNILQDHKVRDISSYHQNVLGPAFAKVAPGEPAMDDKGKPIEAMPYIVLIIDELADIMQTYPRELEGGIVRLAQMSRAVGIHLILSTQRPSVKVITGLIKANIPARNALQVASQIDSRTILDMSGAEKLLGAGDTLFLSGDMAKPRRIQAPYITEDEVRRVVSTIIKQNETMLPDEINFDENAQRANDPIFSSMNLGDDSEDEDELYPEAKRTVVEAGKASTSYLQRKLGIGYARAAKLMDILETKGVIGPADGAKPRSVIGAGNADELANSVDGEEVGI